MSGGQLLEIFILAGIAGFFIYKLNSVLGQKNEGDDQEPENLSRMNLEKKMYKNDRVIEVNDKLRPAISQIQKMDSSFSLASFLDGAEKAFRMIIEAFNDGEVQGIKSFLSPEIYKKFQSSVNTRVKAGDVCHNNILRVKSCAIEKATISDRVAEITVKYETEQIIAYADINGNLIDGDFKEINQITDKWTFSRDLSSNDPNWLLVSTH